MSIPSKRQRIAALFGWEGNRRSGVALAWRHRYPPTGSVSSKNEMKTLPSLLSKYGTLFGSRPNDHYFRSVCLFVCAEFFSAVFDPISIKLGHYVIRLGLLVSPRI